MKLLVLNPNTSAGMTAQVVAEVRRLAPALQVTGVTASEGPPVVASRESYVHGAWAAVRTFREHGAGHDAVLLACFGDPGLAALREVAAVPVAGMAEAAFAEAAALQRPFHVVTAGRAWDAMLREAAGLQRVDALLAGITVLDTTGAEIAQDPAGFAGSLQQRLDALPDAPTCVLAGCGFAGMLPALRYRGVLLDGVGAAVRWIGSALSPAGSGRG